MLLGGTRNEEDRGQGGVAIHVSVAMSSRFFRRWVISTPGPTGHRRNEFFGQRARSLMGEGTGLSGSGLSFGS